ncbi:MAG: methyltransferase, partial [Candidatus Desulfofervidaceae bacterium]|nr:methyltransferase [Candidatus Desulfofervidaceae bacterium]
SLPSHGYLFPIDVFILAIFISLKKNETVLELGTGCGIIALLLAVRYPQLKKIIAVEIQSVLAQLAKKNIILNKFEHLIDILETDMRQVPWLFPPSNFDVVVSNPPYYPLGTGRLNPQEEKAIARHEIKSSLLEVVKIAQYVLKDKGRLYLIYPASRCIHLFVNLRQYNLEPKRLRVVYPYVDKEANFILVEAIKGGKEEVKIAPPLVIYEKPGKYTPEVAAYYEEVIGDK